MWLKITWKSQFFFTSRLLNKSYLQIGNEAAAIVFGAKKIIVTCITKKFLLSIFVDEKGIPIFEANRGYILSTLDYQIKFN